MISRLGPIVALALLSATPVPGQDRPDAEEPHPDLLELSIEELLEIEIVTVSRRPEPVSQAPAAVHVITRADIRRSGATTLPDILRLAPGVQVAQVHAHQWAISTRGFNDVFANKLLVMIDGRTIYSPLFSGVFWDSHHPLLEDIDQVEVIRGPGASLWGANAVNGVINIRTKSSKETQGTLLSGTAGDVDQFIGAIRHGGEFRENHYFRLYAQHRDHTGFSSTEPPDGDDSWDFSQGGFRSDWHLSDISLFTFQGDLYNGRLEESYTRVSENPPHEPFMDNGTVQSRGGNVLARVTRSLDSEADFSFQAFYDRNRRDTEIFTEDRHTVDFDLQHRLPAWNRHTFTWGAGYRFTSDEAENTFDASLDPESRSLNLVSVFAHDEIELIEDRLTFMTGSKFEHNDFTGIEIQPDAAVSWTPHDRHTVWTRVARAIRVPSRVERDVRLNRDTEDEPVLTSVFGSSDFESTELIAYELGYRVQPHDAVSLDLAAFYNDYDDLRSFAPGDLRAEPPPPHIPLFTANEITGETYGGELVANWRASDFWRLHGSYSFLRIDLRNRGEPDPLDTAERTEGSSPRHQVLVRSSLDLPRDWEWDTWFRFVDRLPARDVDRYLEMDMQFAWHPDGDLELAFVGRNLLEEHHLEFTSSQLVRTQQSKIPRSFHAKVTWRF